MENKDAIVNFRVTKKFKDDILKTSYEHDLTIADLLRQAYINYKDVLNNNEDERAKGDL